MTDRARMAAARGSPSVNPGVGGACHRAGLQSLGGSRVGARPPRASELRLCKARGYCTGPLSRGRLWRVTWSRLKVALKREAQDGARLGLEQPRGRVKDTQTYTHTY